MARKSRQARVRPDSPIANQVRQGDVLITPTSAPRRANKRALESGRVVLAHGEVTGHSHDVADAAVAEHYDDAAFQSTTVLDVTAETTIVHQEHAAVPLAPGSYEVRRAAEWSDADEPVQVAD